MSAVFLWLCKAGMILYVFTMLVLTIGYCSVSIYRKLLIPELMHQAIQS